MSILQPPDKRTDSSSLTRNCPLMHVSRLVFEKPLNELQTDISALSQNRSVPPSPQFHHQFDQGGISMSASVTAVSNTKKKSKTNLWLKP
jgi:hypothetical protein